jgi:hypothetical protein
VGTRLANDSNSKAINMQIMTDKKQQPNKRFNGFDYFIFAGGAMNVLVITFLIVFWFIH